MQIICPKKIGNPEVDKAFAFNSAYSRTCYVAHAFNTGVIYNVYKSFALYRD